MSGPSSPNSPKCFFRDLEAERLKKLEFRHPNDDAWYGVELRNDEDDNLVVSYNGFSENDDEVYSPFDRNNDIGDRFRYISTQMQDDDCPKLSVGKKVCASCTSDNDELKFYDAVVTEVERVKHEVDEEGNEVCGCEFKLSWLHGPCINQITTKKVADICLIDRFPDLLDLTIGM